MNKTFLKFVVLSVSILYMGSTALSPAIANIQEVFKDESIQNIMLLVSLPSITMVLASLIFGKLTEFLSRRGVFFLGIGLFLIGGLVPYFMNDLYMILVMRGILGLGLGVIFPLSILLITDFFDGNERNTVMGLQGVFTNIGGMFFPLVGGLLCTTGWHNTFLTYLVGFVFFLFIYAYLPEPKKVEHVAAEGGSINKESLNMTVYFLEFQWFLFTLLWFTFYINIAIQIVGENLGTAASVGGVATVFTIAGVSAGFAYGKMAQMLKGLLIPLGWLLTGIGMAFMAGGHDLTMLSIGSFLAGFGVTGTIPAYWMALSVAAPPSRVPQAIALASVVGGIGQFIVPFVYNPISSYFSQGPGRFPILVASAILLIVGVLLLLQYLMKKQTPEVAIKE